MSRSVYEEAIADAKKVREVAEENAKKAILESVTPRIREFIEEQLLEDGLTFSKEEQEAEEAAMSSQYGDPAIQDVPESVKLDESAIIALVELLGGDEAINSLKEASTKDAMNIAVQAALGRLSDKERQKLFEIADKIERNANNLTSNDINKDIRLKEKDNMSKDKFYEVDLKMLREAVLNEEWGSKSGEDPRRDGHRISGNADYTGDWLEEDDEMSDDDLKEIMASLNEQGDDISALFADVDVEEEGDEMDVEVEDEMDVEVEDEMDIEVEGDDEDLPEDIEDILDNLEDAIMSAINAPRDIEVDIEQVDVEEEDEEVEVDDDVEVDEEEVAMNEVFEIDPRVLRSELSRMRRQIREGKVDHHFGGKGDAKAGVNNSYGGKGAKKLGWQKSFGGGTPGKDPFENPPNINVLKEMRAKMRDATRKNRSMQEKLNKYRSAVQTLREQLEDLNLFNAKLLYVNKLLQNKGLQEGQKKSIIRALDQAQTLKETKMLYKSLTESFTQDKKSTLSESRTRGSSSRAITSSSSKQMNEVNRWATLAGLK